jgi:hypothetical protein
MDIETLKKVATRFESLRKFTATRRVDSEAIAPDRRICMPGDKVEIERWHCYMGPTSLTVNGRPHCIPFGWVMEMGAPAELSQYMPFASKTWPEILEEKGAVGDSASDRERSNSPNA